jgi:signal peptidase
MRSFRAIAHAAATLCSGVVVACVLAYAGLLVTGYKPIAVYSGSMVPTIRVGGLAVDRVVPARDVRVGDVITFQDPYVHGRLVTHRVIRIFHTSHGLAYRTKGDANSARDPWTIALPDRVGRMSFSVPYAGYILWYLHTREIRTALIILGALIALTAMLRGIWRDSPVEAQA